MTGFGDGLAVGPDLVHAAEEAANDAMTPLAGRRPDMMCVFVCSDDPAAVQAAAFRAMEVTGAATTLGCSAGGVIGAGRGAEMTNAVSVWAAHLPGVRCRSFQLDVVRTEDGVGVTGMPERHDDDAVAVLLADPYTFPADTFVERSHEALGGLPLIGGLASGARAPGSSRLFVDGRSVEQGAVGVLLGGPVDVHSLVSQGCRPIGPSMAVTKADGNMLLELAGVPALSKLETIVQDLSPEDRASVANGLHVGIAMDEYALDHERGDFLIRGVVGADRERDAIAIGDVVEVGRTVRFQLRDAAAAEEDLEQMFSRCRTEIGTVDGALLFSCNGRGRAMFGSADHDVLAVQQGLGISGVAGFFAAGEIGPVAGRNHMHGFTASILAFGPPRS
ncbi:MAG: histidine kinase [Pseudonocardiaceae bacterium]|nr:histidine kinase [Pseudonocardiaceae bacterium]